MKSSKDVLILLEESVDAIKRMVEVMAEEEARASDQDISARLGHLLREAQQVISSCRLLMTRYRAAPPTQLSPEDEARFEYLASRLQEEKLQLVINMWADQGRNLLHTVSQITESVSLFDLAGDPTKIGKPYAPKQDADD